MNQFGKFQRISSWVDPENLLMNVGDDFEMATLLNDHRSNVQIEKTSQKASKSQKQTRWLMSTMVNENNG